MTGKDLFDQMLALGGKAQWVGYEGVTRFEAADRAVFEVNRLFPVTKRMQLVNYPLTPVAFYSGIRVHRGGEDIKIDASGIKSLAFAVSGGSGKATLYSVTVNEDGEEELVDLEMFGNDKDGFEMTASFVTYRFIIPGEKQNVRLIFSGKFNYLIQNVSFYGELKSEDAEDVDTFSPWVKYDLSLIDYLGDRFVTFDSTPVRFDNVSLNSPYDYKIENSSLYLRADRPGVYEISVMVKPDRIKNESDEIDIDPQLEDLVALRAAAYLYSVTDTEIADRCLQEYQRLLPLVLANVRKVKTQSQYRNTLKGW